MNLSRPSLLDKFLPARDADFAARHRHNLLTLMILVSSAILIRLLFLRFEVVITPDGYNYAMLAEALAAGKFREGFSAFWSPLYPVLVSIALALNRNVETAGRVVSLVAGSLLIIPVYYLIKDSFGWRAAVLGGVLVALHPLLIYYSLLLLTEATYTTLLITSIFIGWRALRGRGDDSNTAAKSAQFFITGALFGLCYLTRPEAFGFIVIMLAWTLGARLFTRTGDLKAVLRNALFLLLGFFIFALPYIIYVHQQTGVWTISEKFSIHILGGSRLAAALPEDADAAGGGGGSTVTRVVVRLTKAFKQQYQITNMVFPIPFVLVAGLGLFRTRWTRLRAFKDLYLLSFLASAFVGYVLTVPNVRFMVPLIPILLYWTANGIIEIVRWFAESRGIEKGTQHSRRTRTAAILLVVAVLLISVLPLFVYVLRGDKFADYTRQKQAGVWIRQHSATPSPLIMSSSPIASFYARGRYIPLPDEGVVAAVGQARRDGADYIVVSSRSTRGTPSAALLDERQPHPGLQFLQRFGRRSDLSVLVYGVDKSGEALPSSASPGMTSGEAGGQPGDAPGGAREGRPRKY